VLSVNSAHVDRRTLPLPPPLLLLPLMNISATIPSAHQFASPGAALRCAAQRALQCAALSSAERKLATDHRLR